MGKAEETTDKVSLELRSDVSRLNRATETERRYQLLLASHQENNCFDVYDSEVFYEIWDCSDDKQYNSDFREFVLGWLNNRVVGETASLSQKLYRQQIVLNENNQARIARAVARLSPEIIQSADFQNKTFAFQRWELKNQVENAIQLLEEMGVYSEDLELDPKGLHSWVINDRFDQYETYHSPEEFNLNQLDREIQETIPRLEGYHDVVSEPLKERIEFEELRMRFYTEHWDFHQDVWHPCKDKETGWDEYTVARMLSAAMAIQGRFKMHQIFKTYTLRDDPLLTQTDAPLLEIVWKEILPWRQEQYISYLERWLEYAVD